MSAIARTRAFVSYSHADGRPVAEAVVAAVRSAGLDPWIDALIRPGENWQRAIEAELRATVAVVVVLTPRACASDEVMAEWSFALVKGVPVLPAVGLPCDPPYRLGQFQRIDWHGNPNAAALLTRELKRLAAEPPAASPPAGAAARPLPAVNPFIWLGAITDPAAFFDRDREQTTIRHFLTKRQNCQVVGPRRIGKSSLLLQVARRAAGWDPAAVVAYLDLQDPRTETLKGWFTQAAERVGWRKPPKDRAVPVGGRSDRPQLSLGHGWRATGPQINAPTLAKVGPVRIVPAAADLSRLRARD